MNSPLVTIGIITYNSEQYIEHCLQSLVDQTFQDFEILIRDNGSTDQTLRIIKKFPQVKTIPGGDNVGFSRGHNDLIRASETPFYLCLNPDILAEPEFLEKLLKCAKAHPKAGSIGGKLLRWDIGFAQPKTNIIDTVGISIRRSHRFTDIGQGRRDRGQYNLFSERFGISGAAVLYRRKALKNIKFEDEYFDELMFAYKEDIDLAYRLQWAGWTAWYTPEAIAYHDRSVGTPGTHFIVTAYNRLFKSSHNKKLSYLNKKILIAKNWSSQFSLSTKCLTWLYNSIVWLWVHILERALLSQDTKFQGMQDVIAKRKAIISKENPRRIQKFMKRPL